MALVAPINTSIMAPSQASVVEDAPRLPMPSRNPLPLSAGQEAQVRELYHSRVRGYCAAEIKRTTPIIFTQTIDSFKY